MRKTKNNIILVLYAAIIGTIAGLIIWTFLKTMNLGIELLWHTIPNQIDFKYYPIIICLTGGLIIGLWKNKYGDFPEDLEVVIEKVKKEKRYTYKHLKTSIVSALLPLIIGSSIGPEAALTGIIAGLCTWVGDRLKKYFKDIKELTSIGITAVLATIFKSPLFGFVEPIEGEEEVTIPKTSKMILYFMAILSSFGIFFLLNKLTGSSSGMPFIGKTTFKGFNYLYIIVLILIGVILGYLYFISHKIIKIMFKPLNNKTIIKCTTGGLLLGISGTILPLTMFSGEEQITTILENGKNIGIIILIITSITKLFITNICIESGLKGGHFFPLIFSGIALGYAMSLIFNIDSVISMSIVTSSFLSNVIKKPIAVVLLLMIIFPANLIPLMLLTTIIAYLFKTPKKVEIN